MIPTFINRKLIYIYEYQSSSSSEAALSLFTFSSEATPSPQLVSLLFHSEKVEGKRGRGACKKKKGAKNGPALSFVLSLGRTNFPQLTCVCSSLLFRSKLPFFFLEVL